MKTLVIYDSKFGNTKKVAEVIAEAFGNDGRLTKADEFTPSMLYGTDILIVGSPTQQWSYSPSIGTLLDTLKTKKLSGINAAAFDTGYASFLAGSAARKINKALKRMGCRIIAPPHRFVVTSTEGPLAEGELERARDWAARIRNTYLSLRKAA